MKKETRMMDVFVAEDGKVFANEADCSKYEDGVLRDKKSQSANILTLKIVVGHIDVC